MSRDRRDGGTAEPSDGARLQGRATARSGLVREGPLARWSAGPEETRAGVDRTRPTGRPLLTKRLAEDWLRSTLEQARRGTLPGMVRTGVTFADAAAEYMRYIEQDRGRKPSTLRGYRSALNAHLLPAFGEMPIESITTGLIEAWIAGFEGSARSRNKLLIELTESSGGRASSTDCPATPPPTSRSSRCDGAASRGVLARGGVGARPRCRVGAGLSDLPHSGVHRTSDGRVAPCQARSRMRALRGVSA
jgi:hypothetical protein